jgi:hypothetical protein
LKEEGEREGKFYDGHDERDPTDGFFFLLVQEKENPGPEEGQESDPGKKREIRLAHE